MPSKVMKFNGWERKVFGCFQYYVQELVQTHSIVEMPSDQFPPSLPLSNLLTFFGLIYI